MFSLALSLIRNHKAGLAGVFVAVLFGSAVLTACGVLIDSGLRGGCPPAGCPRSRGSPAPLRRDASGFLSAASMHARSRRMSLAATPLIIAVALSAVQLFTTTTMVAARLIRRDLACML